MKTQSEQLADDRAAFANYLRRVILTDKAMPDKERALLYNSTKAAWPATALQDFYDAYGYTEQRPVRFRPSPGDYDRYLDYMGILTSYMSKGQHEKKLASIVTERAFNRPKWSLAQQHGVTKRTIDRWHKEAIDQMFFLFRTKQTTGA